MQPVIRRNRETGERELVMMRWGIVPWFAKTEIEFKKLSTSKRETQQRCAKRKWRPGGFRMPPQFMEAGA